MFTIGSLFEILKSKIFVSFYYRYSFMKRCNNDSPNYSHFIIGYYVKIYFSSLYLDCS